MIAKRKSIIYLILKINKIVEVRYVFTRIIIFNMYLDYKLIEVFQSINEFLNYKPFGFKAIVLNKFYKTFSIKSCDLLNSNNNNNDEKEIIDIKILSSIEVLDSTGIFTLNFRLINDNIEKNIRMIKDVDVKLVKGSFYSFKKIKLEVLENKAFLLFDNISNIIELKQHNIIDYNGSSEDSLEDKLLCFIKRNKNCLSYFSHIKLVNTNDRDYII